MYVKIRGLSALAGDSFPPTLCGCVGETVPLLLNKRLNCNQELSLLLLPFPPWVRYILVPVTRIELRRNKGEYRVKKKIQRMTKRLRYPRRTNIERFLIYRILISVMSRLCQIHNEKTGYYLRSPCMGPARDRPVGSALR